MRSWSKSGLPRLWVAALALVPLLGVAQPAAVDPAASWRQANALVAQFPRGHADLLKWEQAQSPQASAAAMATATPEYTLDLHSAESVVELV
jgi:cytochrome c peroxidase